MSKVKWPQLFTEYALCLVAFSIPFPFIYATISIGILALAWITQLRFKDTFIKLKERKVLWLWVIYFLLHAVSYYYSDNKDQSAFDTQQKLSFLLLPILIGAGTDIDRKTLERVFLAFITGTTLITIWCLANAGIRWAETHDKTVFFYHDLVKGLEANAVYMAWYFIFAISLLLFMPWKYFFKKKPLKIALTLLLLFFFVLLSARMLLLIFFILIIPFYFRHTINKFSKTKIVLSITGIIVLFIIVLVTDNPLRSRYENIYNTKMDLAFQENYKGVSEGDFNNVTLRIFLWRVGILNVKEHNLWLTGAGNGDAQALQNSKMEQMGIPNISEPIYRSPFHNANLHNMFMQSLVMLGIPGILTFLLIAFLPFLYINKNSFNQAFLFFHIIAVFFLMQEAALQTQAGVIYYTFFSQIFWNITLRRPTLLKNELNVKQF